MGRDQAVSTSPVGDSHMTALLWSPAKSTIAQAWQGMIRQTIAAPSDEEPPPTATHPRRGTWWDE